MLSFVRPSRCTARATGPNPDRLLVDQELVGVTVIAKQPDRKLVVSQSAILLDQQGATWRAHTGSTIPQRRTKRRAGSASNQHQLSSGVMDVASRAGD